MKLQDQNTPVYLEDLCKKIRLRVIPGEPALPREKWDDWQKTATYHKVWLRYGARELTIDYWMGSAHTKPPEVQDVMDCLISDASGIENNVDFPEWCKEYGEDTDSRKAHDLWRRCVVQYERVKKFLGDDFETFLLAERKD